MSKAGPLFGAGGQIQEGVCGAPRRPHPSGTQGCTGVRLITQVDPNPKGTLDLGRQGRACALAVVGGGEASFREEAGAWGQDRG